MATAGECDNLAGSRWEFDGLTEVEDSATAALRVIGDSSCKRLFSETIVTIHYSRSGGKRVFACYWYARSCEVKSATPPPLRRIGSSESRSVNIETDAGCFAPVIYYGHWEWFDYYSNGNYDYSSTPVFMVDTIAPVSGSRMTCN